MILNFNQNHEDLVASLIKKCSMLKDAKICVRRLWFCAIHLCSSFYSTLMQGWLDERPRYGIKVFCKIEIDVA